MAHSFGSTVLTRSSAATSPITRSATTAAGDTVLVLMLKTVGGTNRAGGSPTFNGVAGLQANATQKAAASPEAGAELWYWVGGIPSGTTGGLFIGTADIVIPNTGTATIFSSAYTGQAAAGFTSMLDVAAGSNGTSTNPTTTAMVTTANGDIFFGTIASGAQTWNPSATTGTSLFDVDDGAHGGGGQYFLQTSSGSQALVWTFGTSDDWGAVGAAFKEVPAPVTDTGSLSFNGTVTGIAFGLILGGAASLGFAGPVATVNVSNPNNKIAAPSVGQLVFKGPQTPPPSPSNGVLTLAGYAPNIAFKLPVGTGSLAFYGPGIPQPTIPVNPGVGSLDLTGRGVGLATAVQTPQAVLSASGQSPAMGLLDAMLVGSLTLSGPTPTAAVSGGGSGSWAFVNAAADGDFNSSTTISTAVSGVQAGDLVVVWTKWEGSTPTVSCSDGTTSLTNWSLGNIVNAGGDPRGTAFYNLSSVASGTVTYTVTFSSAQTWRTIVVMVYRPTGGTVSLDGTPSAAFGTGTALNSGNTTTSGTVGVSFGFYGEFGSSLNTQQINGVAFDQFKVGPQPGTDGQDHRDMIWSKTYSSGFTGAATGTLSGSNDWLGGILSFKITSSGGSDTPIGVGLGSLSLAGVQPTGKIGFVAGPPVGSLSFAGQAPVASGSSSIAIPVGSLATAGLGQILKFTIPSPQAGVLAFSSQAPVLATGRFASSPSGALAFTGQAPSTGLSLGLPIGNLTLSGLASAVGGSGAISIPVGSIGFTSQAPAITGNIVASPAPAALAFYGPAQPTAFFAVPDVGALTFTGRTPTVTAAAPNVNVAPGVGTISFSGQTPARLVGPVISIPAGSLTFAGQYYGQAFGGLPPAALSLTGLAPSVQASGTRATPAGSLAFTGQAPSLARAAQISIPVGTLRFKGPQTQTDFYLTSATATLSFSGYALSTQPQVTISVPVGSLSLAGQSQVANNGKSISVGVGTLTLDGQYFTQAYFDPSVCQLILTGWLPNVAVSGNKVPGVGSLVLSGQAPALKSVVAIPQGSLTLVGQLPAVNGSGSITTGVGSLSLAGQNNALKSTIGLPVGALTLATMPPAIGGASIVQIPVGALTASGAVPAVNTGRTAQPAVGSLTFTGQTNTTRTAIGLPVGTLTLAGTNSFLNGAGAIVPGTVSMAVAGLAPAASIGLKALPGSGGLAFTGQNQSLKSTVSVGLGTLTLSPQLPSLAGSGSVQPGVGAMAVTGRALSLALTVNAPVGVLTVSGPDLNLLRPIVSMPAASLALQGHAPILDRSVNGTPMGLASGAGSVRKFGAVVSTNSVGGAVINGGVGGTVKKV